MNLKKLNLDLFLRYYKKGTEKKCEGRHGNCNFVSVDFRLKTTQL